MKKVVLSFILLVAISCSQKIDKAQIESINGYWQIEKALDADGNKKEFPVNEFYDYFEIKNQVGFHKKVKWQPDGTFLVNDVYDKVKIVERESDFYVELSSAYGTITEKIDVISNEELVLVSEDDSKFYFKKVEIKNPGDGKKTE